MIKKVWFLAVLGLLFTASDCDKGTPLQNGEVDLNFKADFNGTPLVMYAREYPYEDSMSVKFQLFQFYLSEITLLSNEASGKEKEIVDVELISFKEIQDEGAAAAGLHINVADIPPGAYSGIRMGIGLGPVANATNPGDYPAGHPLSDHYWSAALGYVFSKIEGNADLDGNGEYTQGITFHSGADELFREKTFVKSFTVPEGGVAKLNFKVDLRDVLVNSAGSFLDFRETPIDHTTDIEIARFITDNLKNALTLVE